MICLSASPQDTSSSAGALARRLPKGAVVLLVGELGAGKTAFAGGLLQGLGYSGGARSPTFTLINEYRWDNKLVAHLDLYRLADPLEIVRLGLEDYLRTADLIVVEWGAPLAAELECYATVELTITGPSTRRIAIKTHHLELSP